MVMSRRVALAVGVPRGDPTAPFVTPCRVNAGASPVRLLYIVKHQLLNSLLYYSQIFLSWPLGAERQTCHVTLIVPHVMN